MCGISISQINSNWIFYIIFLIILTCNSFGSELIDFENDSSINYFYGNIGEYGRDGTYHNESGEWSLRLRDANCKYSRAAFAKVVGGQGEIQFKYKTHPTYQNYVLNFSLDGTKNISIIPQSGWQSSGLIPINIQDGLPQKILWDYKQIGTCDSSASSLWIDDIELIGQLRLVSDNISTIRFFNESFTPRKGSLLSPFSFEIEIEDPPSTIESSRFELQIKNYSDNRLEIQVFNNAYNTTENKIIFNNIIFTSPGKKKFRIFCGSFFSNEYEGPDISPLDTYVKPSEGCNMDKYDYIINITSHKLDRLFDIYLDIKYPYGWKCVGKGIWNRDNITFAVNDFDFADYYLGNVEYMFRTDYGTIGPLNGPYIFINFKDIVPDQDAKTVTAKVISDRCNEEICLSINGQTYKENYKKCNDEEKLEWNNIDFQKAKELKIRSCGKS